MLKIILSIAILLSITLNAQNIYVKYRGDVNVDNGHFAHLNIGYSSLVKDMYYDKTNNYLLVELKSTYYHYCGISTAVIDKWVSSSSLGKYYLNNIKGNYDCRVFPMPQY